eukprot:m.115816 g.115816  ORF g.115816 m.115816 type:complete len:363 (-) comp19410_c0_seq1:170-1258(-)
MAACRLLMLLVLLCAAPASSALCRDRLKQPFASASVWNTAIGSGARFSPAHLFPPNTALPLPHNIFGDTDFFTTSSIHDPLFPWYDQGWWGKKSVQHCDIVGPLFGVLRLPPQLLVPLNESGNNGMAVLLPDNVTLVQMQPFYRCSETGPMFALAFLAKRYNESILGNGTLGAHGGSGLSALGGSVRLGELLPDTPPIAHALKLELYAKHYYYGGLEKPCYHWPAVTCDDYAHDDSSPLRYNGSNAALTPGGLLAIPSAAVPAVTQQLQTVPGRKLLAALHTYGGYLVDDTAAVRATVCLESGVEEEFERVYGFAFAAKPGEAFYADVLLLFQQLQIVINNAENAVGGGGTPLAPPAPPICP